MSQAGIDVRFEAEHEAVTLRDDRPMLTWGIFYPRAGRCWTLWYMSDDTETAGVESYIIPGDLLDVDDAVEQAASWLAQLAADTDHDQTVGGGS